MTSSSQEFQQWKLCMQAQQQCLEILTNICTEELEEGWHKARSNVDQCLGEEETAEGKIPAEVINYVVSSSIFDAVCHANCNTE
jgi:hypothetical protein